MCGDPSAKSPSRGHCAYVRHRPAAAAEGDGDPRWDLFESCLQVAAASWQGSSSTGNTLTHEQVLPFLRNAHAAAAKAGALDMNLLYVGDRPAAFNYAYHYQGHVFGLRTGYDPQLGGDGAGSVLQCKMIADSFDRGDRLYDLGSEYLDCKRYWLTKIEESSRFNWFSPRTPRAQLLRAKRTLALWLERQPTPPKSAAGA